MAIIDANQAGEALVLPKFEWKFDISAEQKGAVAALSQLRTIAAQALPQSNQIEATLFV